MEINKPSYYQTYASVVQKISHFLVQRAKNGETDPVKEHTELIAGACVVLHEIEESLHIAKPYKEFFMDFMEDITESIFQRSLTNSNYINIYNNILGKYIDETKNRK